MTILQVHARKNTMEDVLLDGGLGVNIIIKDLRKRLGLLIQKCAPFTFRMVDQTLTKQVGLIQDLKIHIHNISYVITFIVMKNNVLDAR